MVNSPVMMVLGHELGLPFVSGLVLALVAALNFDEFLKLVPIVLCFSGF